jgi:hypothetical protein
MTEPRSTVYLNSKLIEAEAGLGKNWTCFVAGLLSRPELFCAKPEMLKNVNNVMTTNFFIPWYKGSQRCEKTWKKPQFQKKITLEGQYLAASERPKKLYQFGQLGFNGLKIRDFSSVLQHLGISNMPLFVNNES